MATGPRRRRIGGHELVEQLNELIAQLIKENRKLKRQVDKLAARGSASASTTVDRGLRTIQRRVQKALSSTGTRKRRQGSTGRKTTTKRRRSPKA